MKAFFVRLSAQKTNNPLRDKRYRWERACQRSNSIRKKWSANWPRGFSADSHGKGKSEEKTMRSHRVLKSHSDVNRKSILLRYRRGMTRCGTTTSFGLDDHRTTSIGETCDCIARAHVCRFSWGMPYMLEFDTLGPESTDLTCVSNSFMLSNFLKSWNDKWNDNPFTYSRLIFHVFL